MRSQPRDNCACVLPAIAGVWVDCLFTVSARSLTTADRLVCVCTANGYIFASTEAHRLPKSQCHSMRTMYAQIMHPCLAFTSRCSGSHWLFSARGSGSLPTLRRRRNQLLTTLTCAGNHHCHAGPALVVFTAISRIRSNSNLEHIQPLPDDTLHKLYGLIKYGTSVAAGGQLELHLGHMEVPKYDYKR